MRLTRRILTTTAAAALSATLAVAGGGASQAIAANPASPVIGAVAPEAATAFIDAVAKIEPSVVRQVDGTLTITTTAAKVGVTEDTFRLVAQSVDVLNEMVRKGQLRTTPGLGVSEPGQGPSLMHNAINVRWWGVEVHLDAYWTNKLLGAMWAGAGVATLISILTAALGGSGLIAGIVAAILAIGAGVIQFCSNSNGVIIAKPYVGPPYCRGH
jgi:hypothetical protein